MYRAQTTVIGLGAAFPLEKLSLIKEQPLSSPSVLCPNRPHTGFSNLEPKAALLRGRVHSSVLLLSFRLEVCDTCLDRQNVVGLPVCL